MNEDLEGIPEEYLSNRYDEDDMERFLAGANPISEEKQSIHTFLHSVATSKDTTKTGFVTAEELGMPKFPIRSFKEMALISDKLIGCGFFKDYFEQESEIVTSTSLSKDAKLLTLAVTQKREVGNPSKKIIRRGWFKRKEETQE